jgi:tRNA G18 (ribose-2'-O)-methylase SpoU
VTAAVAARQNGDVSPTVTTITDPDDERIADYRALTDVELRTRWEPPNGLFIAEGELVLRRALRAGYRPRSVLVDAKRVAEVAAAIDAERAPSAGGGRAPAGDVPVYAGTQDVLEKATGFHVHRGVLASFHRRPPATAAEVLATASRVAILEDVNNHTNVGAIFRGAAALGVDAVLLSPSCADPLYRRAVRVSMGEVFAVPYARLEPWPAGLEQVRAAGFTLLALTPAPDAVAIQRLTADQRARTALLLGAEGSGLTPAAQAASDVRVVIPMHRGVDSLNVAAAAAVAFWELCRDAAGPGGPDGPDGPGGPGGAG